MNKILFSEVTVPNIAILIKESSFKLGGLREYYGYPLEEAGIDPGSVIAYPLEYPSAKVTVKQARSYLEALLPELLDDGITLIYAADAEYFRQLTGNTGNADVHLGYVLPCTVPNYTHMNVVLGSSYASIFHNPATQIKITQSLSTLVSFSKGIYLPPGSDIFDKIELIDTQARISELLADLITKPALTVDIETRSLHFRDAGISSIAFGESSKLGYSFAVDTHGGFGLGTRKILKEFFTNYQGTTVWHNANYDLKILVYSLWMKHPLDHVGMMEGISVMTRNFHDTRLIAYLALNSCVRVEYSLKVLAQEFAGNYAEQDIKDVMLIARDDLLRYNGVDVLATWYVFDKYYQKMIDDQQNELYEGLFKDSVALLLQIELTGMPLNMDKVLFAEKELQTIEQKYLKVLAASPIIQSFTDSVQQKACDTKQATLKKKIVTIADFAHVEFNPASGPQVQTLLYEVLGLPIIDLTKKKQPATGNKTLTKLMAHTQDPQILTVLDALVELGKVSKILSAFIPVFKDAWLKADGCHYLHGNFKLGGPVSGRLSCSGPNLQQTPAGSTYGKLIKDCFSAAPGWIMAGADFSSLEDKINALLTQDKNKIKVYADGYDGHSLRTYAYFKDQLTGIVDTVASINTMQEKSSPYYHLRSKSKAPTFALTFQGTYITLMKNCGFTEAEAKAIEANYHILYADSVVWTKAKLSQASKDGYATAAFGLRVRCPLLKQVVYGSRSMPFEAQAEARTLGNAISGQSYGLLNNRAAVEFNERLQASPFKNDVKIIALIHDAIYLLIRDDIHVVEWVNNNLPDCMQWQDLPELQHPIVKLGGDLDLFYPSWAHSHTLPNNITQDEILTICSNAVDEMEAAVI